MSEEKRCGSCKHWTEYDGYRDPVQVHYDLERNYETFKVINEEVNRGDRWRKCRGVEENPERTMVDGKLVEPIPLAVTRDGSDYLADLLTQAEFGCVLWEATT